MNPTGATAELNWPFKKIEKSPIKIIGNLVHPFRNVLFGVGIFVGFWELCFWLVFKFLFTV